MENSIDIVVTQTGGTTEVTEGGATDSFKVVLTGAPTANVVVTITPDSQLKLGSNQAGTPITLTFKPTNYR